MLDFLPGWVIPAIAALWVIGFLMCMLNAYVPASDVYGNARSLTKRTQARLALTGWFFPIAAPIWLAVFLYLAIAFLLTGLYNTVRTAFSRDDGGRI